MTKKMQIKRLKQQNEKLIEQNMALRQKTPTAEYAKKIDENLEKFDRINDDLLKLYKQLHVIKLQNKNVTFRYKIGIWLIKLKQFFGI